MQQRHSIPLIFCERSGRWAAAWRLAWSRRPRGADSQPNIRLMETRSPSECLEALEAVSAAFVVLELTAADCDRMLELLFEISTRRRGVAMAVAAERSMQAYQWLARELGAVHFLISPRELASLAGMVQRFALRHPQEELDFEQSVWANLPWSRR